MASLNRVQVIGNVGTEPEMRFTGSGTPVTSFSVACNRTYTTNDGERKEETEWFSVVTWQKLAETCNQYVYKGQQVYIEGRLQTRKWEGEDGEKHYKTEIVANQVLFLGKRENQTDSETTPEEVEPGDVPF